MASAGICRALRRPPLAGHGGSRRQLASATRQGAQPAPPVITSLKPSGGNGDHSAEWIKQTMQDYYGSRASVQYRSPAAWGLRQLDDRFSVFKPGCVVLDLGCFPGGWSEVAVERSQASSSPSLVIGVDKVKMDPLKYHTFIQGDAGEETTLDKVLHTLGDRRADVVLCDLLPARTGLKIEDHMASMQGCLHGAMVMEKTLRIGGWFITRMISGTEQANWRTYLDSRFEIVRTTKPPGGRQGGREMFTMCKGFKGRGEISAEVDRPATAGYKHEGRDQWDAEIRKQPPRREVPHEE